MPNTLVWRKFQHINPTAGAGWPSQITIVSIEAWTRRYVCTVANSHSYNFGKAFTIHYSTLRRNYKEV